MESNVSGNEMPSNNLSDYLDRLEKSEGSNRDADGLGTTAAGPFVIGSVDAVKFDLTKRNIDAWRRRTKNAKGEAA